MKHILGKRLQEDAIILGTMAGTITQAVNNDYGNRELFRDIADDLLIVAAGLGTDGSMIRINNRDPAAGRLLRMNMKKTIFNDVIKNEIKEVKEIFRYIIIISSIERGAEYLHIIIIKLIIPTLTMLLEVDLI
jgi:hypothetical protein